VALAGVLACASCRASEPAEPAQAKKHIQSKDGFLMVLRQGDDVLEQLKQLARTENVQSATFTGFGFVHATFGYFDPSKKDYLPRELRDVELASLQGSLAWQDGQPSLHAHGVVTDREFRAYGGHLLALWVGSGSVELVITTRPDKLSRLKDPALGANVLSLEAH
jgi:predicted DNA-binding protein with PD1-like motif